jgi:methionine-gamma-lyase
MYGTLEGGERWIRQQYAPEKKQPIVTRTHLIHGSPDSKRWDYNHHVIPPLTASTTYRLSSAHRGEQGFIEFAQ